MAKKEEKPGLTRAQAHNYLDGRGNYCPYCDFDIINGGPLQTDGPQAWGEVICVGCQRTWRDIYHLQRIVETEDGGRFVAAFDRPAPAALVEVEEGGIQYTTRGAVTIVVVDWDEVKSAEDPELIRKLIAAVEALPPDCDPGNRVRDGLNDKLIALEGGRR